MSDIEHWSVYRCDNCGYLDVVFRTRCIVCDTKQTNLSFEVVRATDYQGAVEENRELRALIYQAPGGAAGSDYYDWVVKAKRWLTDHPVKGRWADG